MNSYIIIKINKILSFEYERLPGGITNTLGNKL